MATPPRRTKIRVHLALRMVNAACRWFRCKFTKFSARPQYPLPQFSIPIFHPVFHSDFHPEPSRALPSPPKQPLPSPTRFTAVRPQFQVQIHARPRQLRLQEIQSQPFAFRSAALHAPRPARG